MLIPNPDLDFRTSYPKIHFWANLGPNIQSCPFCLKIKSEDSESGYRFLRFRPQNPFLGKFWSKKSKLSLFLENWHTSHLDDGDSYSNISFLNFQPLIHFWANLGKKSQSCPVWLKIGTQCLDDVDSYSDIAFFNFQF